MRQATNTIVVHVPAAILWDYLADYESMIRLASSTATAHLKSGTTGSAGATYEGSLEWEGIKSTWIVHLQQAARPDSLTWESCSHGGECWLRFDLTPIDEGDTSVSVTLAWGANKPNAPLEPFAWGLLTPLFKSAVSRLRRLSLDDVS